MRGPTSGPPFAGFASQGFLWLLLVITLTALFLAINAVQITSAGTGQRLLRRAVAPLTDLDTQLPSIHRELHEQAETNTASDTVSVPTFPIPIGIEKTRAATISQEELRAVILAESARQIYAEGMDVLAGLDPEAQRDTDFISTAGAIDRGLGLITEGNHNRILIAAVVLGLISAALTVLLFARLRSYGRLLAAGVLILAASLPALAAVVALRFGFRTAQDDAHRFVNDMLRLGIDALELPIRNYISLAVLGAALLALGFVQMLVATRATTTTLSANK